MRLPLVLAFVATSTAAVVASCQSGSGDDTSCELHCVYTGPPTNDAGVVIDALPITCPECADPTTLECPVGCQALG